MNDIGQRDVETYVRNLISKDFGSKTDNINRRDRQQGEGAHETTSSTPKSKVTQKDWNSANGGMNTETLYRVKH